MSEKINPDGWARTSICYSSIYHICLTKLLEDCCESMGECTSCFMHKECLPLWDIICGKRCNDNRASLNSDTFPIFILRFAKIRDKARERAYQAVKANYQVYKSVKVTT